MTIRTAFITTAFLALSTFSVGQGTSQNSGEKPSGNEPANSRKTLETVDIGTFDQMVANTPDAVIIDLRTPDEVANGTIPNAIILDYFDDHFEDELSKLPRETTYFIYCRSGNRSGKTLGKMENLGFLSVYDLDGGYKAWAKAHGITFED